MQGRTGIDYTLMFTVKDGTGAPVTGLAPSAFTARVRALTPGVDTSPAVSEIGNGRYEFTVLGTFSAAQGIGEYGWSVEINSVAPAILDLFSGTVRFLAADDGTIAADLGYTDGAIWVDAAGGTVGTVYGVNGTQRNPVTTLADAKTIGDANNLHRIRFTGGAQAYTLLSAFVGYEFIGDANTAFIDLNNQDVSSSVFCRCVITGGSTIGGPVFEDCDIGTFLGSIDLVFFEARDCIVNGTIRATLGRFIGCRTSSVIIDKVNDLNNTTTVIESFGDWIFRNWDNDTTDTFHIDVEGRVQLEATFGDGSADANLLLLGRGELINNGNLGSLDSSSFVVNPYVVRQGWTRATTGGSFMRAIVHLEQNGEMVALPATAEVAIEARDRTGAIIAAFTTSGVTAGAKGYFSIDSVAFNPSFGEVITIQATITLSGLSDGTHVGRDQVTFPEF